MSVVLYSITLFWSAFLLFSVQPMVGKLILPALGGSPAVWTTCMVFFQAALLAGYAYAHASVSVFSGMGARRPALGGLAHLALMLLALLVLPIRIAHDGAAPPEANPAFWLLARLLVFVGMPFFVVAATAPLLQRWFARTAHPDAEDPYFLYSISNAGSLTALLAYPLAIEPFLSVDQQSAAWRIAFIALIALLFGCATVLWDRGRPIVRPAAQSGERAQRVEPQTRRAAGGGPQLQGRPDRRLRWMALAMVPSSLMLGVTSHITTDLAAVPLLWVLPLAIYLLTFVLTFSRSASGRSLRSMSLALAVGLPVWMLTPVQIGILTWLLIPMHMLLFFIAAMVCHGRLAEDRPPKERLTEFYLWISIGGVLGGLFNAIIAPAVFTRVIEYPLMLVAACLLRPNLGPSQPSGKARLLDLLWPAALAAVGYAAVGLGGLDDPRLALAGKIVAFALLPTVVFLLRRRSVRFALSFGAFLIIAHLYADQRSGRVLAQVRNFFGVKRVVVSEDGVFRQLVHGGTTHGIQRIGTNTGQEPLGYYHRSGPLGDVFAAFDRLDETQEAGTVGIIGLGTGCMAAYAKPNHRLTFFEIDPQVAQIANDTRFFSYLSECPAKVQITIGDGRQALARAPNAFDLIILDAFSSDAVPTHLLTREALRVYLSKLEPQGLLCLHLSNRYLDLIPIVANLAHDAGANCLARHDGVAQAEQKNGRFPSSYAVLARDPAPLMPLLQDPRWRRMVHDPAAPLWTDRHSDLVSVFKFKSN